jgi:nicotinamide-nucleotide amidase
VNPEDLAAAVVAALGGCDVATAESCTAGRLASAFASAEGASGFLRGAVVAYHEGIKRDLLGVSAPSVYSEEAAIEMARGVCRLLGADAAVATTGVVGGEPVDGVPTGTVFVGTCVGGEARSSVHQFAGSPETICEAATRQALADLLDAARSRLTGSGSAREA